MFPRIIAVALLLGALAAGFGGESIARPVRPDAVVAPLAELPPQVEEHHLSSRWVFNRSSSTEDSETISRDAVVSFLVERFDPQIAGTLVSALSYGQHRPCGLILLCDRAIQKRSGVLKS